jgi:hypothetical protein
MKCKFLHRIILCMRDVDCLNLMVEHVNTLYTFLCIFVVIIEHILIWDWRKWSVISARYYDSQMESQQAYLSILP